MVQGNRVGLMSGSSLLVFLPRPLSAPSERDDVLSPFVAVRELERWCSDPATLPRVLELYERVTGSALSSPTARDLERHIKPVLRLAFETEAWLAYNGTGLQAAPARPTLQFASPAANTQFVIDDMPQMPALAFEVHVQGVVPDPTPTTSFEWTAELRHNPSVAGDRHGPNRTFLLQANGTSVGGRFSVVFTGLSGGTLTVRARGTVDGNAIEVSSVGLMVVATNPSAATVQAEIGDDLLRRIACHESGQRQFDAARGATSRSPLWSGDNLGGVGLFQITVPRPTDDQVWNWRSNVTAGRNRLQQGRATARNYPRQIRNSNTLATMLANLNAQRTAAGRPTFREITIPNLTAAQIEDDAVRAFNGFGGNRDVFGFALHEFRLQMAGANLNLVIDEGAVTATAVWERVPVADRGTSGDPDYVNHVNGANPACP